MDIKLFVTPDMAPIVQLPPDKSRFGDEDPRWMTLTYIEFEINGVRHSIRPGFITNLGSVPKFVRHIVDPVDETTLAYVIHDYLYSKDPDINISQKDADKALYKIALMCEQDRLEAGAAWAGVRLGGWTSYKKSKPHYKKVSKDLLRKICEDNNFTPKEFKK